MRPAERLLDIIQPISSGWLALQEQYAAASLMRS